jgi:hypothetical protein
VSTPLTTDALNLPAQGAPPVPACVPVIMSFAVVDNHDNTPSPDPIVQGAVDIVAGSTYYLVWPTNNVAACTLTTTDGGYTNVAEPANSPFVFTDEPVGSSNVPFNPPYNNGSASTATLTCGAPFNTVSSSFTYIVVPTPAGWLGTWDGSLASTCSYAGPFDVVITSLGGNLLNVAWTASGSSGDYVLRISGNTATDTGGLGITYTLNGTSINVNYPAACQTGTVTLQSPHP